MKRKFNFSLRKQLEYILSYKKESNTKITQSEIASMLDVSRYTLQKELSLSKYEYKATEAQLNYEEEERIKLEKELERNRRSSNMATRRMLANDIIREPNFITLPHDAKALYFILNLEADDNGFVQPFTILELHKFNEEALFKLASLGYITLFMGIENQGIVNKAVVDNSKLEFAKQLNIKNIYACVIKDWFIHNSLNKNYFKPTKFKDEMKMLKLYL